MIWLLSILLCCSPAEDWGFFGHRVINRMAVYTLPTELIGWYKPYIDYISEHAVDPDKRRYATKHEAVRHYIDLDQWGTMPFDHIPRNWSQVLALNLRLYTVSGPDTMVWLEPLAHEQWASAKDESGKRLQIIRKYYLGTYYDDVPMVISDTINRIYPELNIPEGQMVIMEDEFSAHGILPYHLQSMQSRLTKAFEESDLEKVLRLTADFGHYIGDACVPLHTTKNYNGQLTDQIGIHAFWESRIPEMVAMEEFDMIVGPAEYIEDKETFFWDLVLTSHKEVDRVLSIEKELRTLFPEDQQFCFEERLNTTVLTQCEAFARAYHEAMNLMVEDRFRLAIKSMGDAVYSAWIDAGQPAFPGKKNLAKKSAEDDELDRAVQSGKALGREHAN